MMKSSRSWTSAVLVLLLGCVSVSTPRDEAPGTREAANHEAESREAAVPDTTNQNARVQDVGVQDDVAAATEPAPPITRDERPPEPSAAYVERTDGPIVTGYWAWWMRESWKQLDLSLYDRIMFFSLYGSADGSIAPHGGWPEAQSELLQFLVQEKVNVVPTIAVLHLDTLKSIHASPRSEARFMAESMRVFRESGRNGLHIDIEVFEPVDEWIREGFLSYIDGLSGAMKAENPDAVLSLFIPAFDNALMYDLDRLGASVDLFMVQGYDLHWMDGPQAGPLSPLTGWEGVNWNTIVDRFLAGGIEPKKIIMTVPYYAYEWPVSEPVPGAATLGRAAELTLESVDSTLVPLIHDSVAERLRESREQRDPISGSPYYVRETDDGWRMGWYEDDESLMAKYRFIEERGLGGVAVFPIGYDNGRMDYVIRRVFGSR